MQHCIARARAPLNADAEAELRLLYIYIYIYTLLGRLPLAKLARSPHRRPARPRGARSHDGGPRRLRLRLGTARCAWSPPASLVGSRLGRTPTRSHQCSRCAHAIFHVRTCHAQGVDVDVVRKDRTRVSGVLTSIHTGSAVVLRHATCVVRRRIGAYVPADRHASVLPLVSNAHHPPDPCSPRAPQLDSTAPATARFPTRTCLSSRQTT